MSIRICGDPSDCIFRSCNLETRQMLSQALCQQLQLPGAEFILNGRMELSWQGVHPWDVAGCEPFHSDGELLQGDGAVKTLPRSSYIMETKLAIPFTVDIKRPRDDANPLHYLSSSGR
ncbi:unnamed protein product [Lampetra fluviatilis]